ncbi:MAG: hypothetical protein EBX35_10395, partial [Planctomycetia bacterium]|nr:hypothetical protein [Planctomycetia bacterium]
MEAFRGDSAGWWGGRPFRPDSSKPLKNRPERACGWPCRALLAVCIACGQGCTSVLSTASLRDLVWDGGEPHAAETAAVASDSAESEAAASAGDESGAADSEALDAERREAAIDEAVERLAKLGAIDEAARATLVQTLERTAPEDWPAVIDAFAESLPPAAHVAAKADLDGGEGPTAEPAPEPGPMA